MNTPQIDATSLQLQAGIVSPSEQAAADVIRSVVDRQLAVEIHVAFALLGSNKNPWNLIDGDHLSCERFNRFVDTLANITKEDRHSILYDLNRIGPDAGDALFRERWSVQASARILLPLLVDDNISEAFTPASSPTAHARRESRMFYALCDKALALFADAANAYLVAYTKGAYTKEAKVE